MDNNNKMAVLMMHLYEIWPITVKPHESEVQQATLYFFKFMHIKNIP